MIGIVSVREGVYAESGRISCTGGCQDIQYHLSKFI
jgi:hypothetical protein